MKNELHKTIIEAIRGNEDLHRKLIDLVKNHEDYDHEYFDDPELVAEQKDYDADWLADELSDAVDFTKIARSLLV